jgi:hypothetical protein
MEDILKAIADRIRTAIESLDEALLLTKNECFSSNDCTPQLHCSERDCR